MGGKRLKTSTYIKRRDAAERDRRKSLIRRGVKCLGCQQIVCRCEAPFFSNGDIEVEAPEMVQPQLEGM